MNAVLLCVGKLKERFYVQACQEYQKRLSRFLKLSVIEVADSQEPAQKSDAALERIKDEEAKRILAHIRPDDTVITLEIGAKQLSSEDFAKKMQELSLKNRVVFVIGGSLGLGRAVLARSNIALSLSALTFPHQLARVVLLEQIYRACKISAGQRYHK